MGILVGIYIDGSNLQVASRRSRIAGHCFTNTESILNILKANLRPKNFCLGLIRPKVSF